MLAIIVGLISAVLVMFLVEIADLLISTQASSFLGYVMQLELHLGDLKTMVYAKGGTITVVGVLNQVGTAIYGTGIGLMILLFLLKNFGIYALGTEGDPGSDPFGYLVNFIKAMVIASCFPTMYGWASQIANGLNNQIMLNIITDLSTMKNDSFIKGLNPICGIIAMIFAVNFIILFLQFINRGVEMMVLRLGIPLACVGLLDNDGGIFKNYINVMVKSVVTTIVQFFMMFFGILMFCASTGGLVSLIVAAGFMTGAVKAPKLMSEFLVPTGGGGSPLAGAAHFTQAAATVVKMFV